MAIDLSAKLGSGGAVITVLTVAAQAPGTVQEDVIGIHGAQAFRLFLEYTAGALVGGQTLDVLIDQAPRAGTFYPWFAFTTLAAATAPPQVQAIQTCLQDYGSGGVSNAALTAVGSNPCFPMGTLRVRGVLSAGAGTPSYTVTLLALGV